MHSRDALLGVGTEWRNTSERKTPVDIWGDAIILCVLWEQLKST